MCRKRKHFESSDILSHDPGHLGTVVPPSANYQEKKRARGYKCLCDIIHNIIVSCAEHMSKMKEKIGV